MRIFNVELRNTFCKRIRKAILFFVLISTLTWYIDYKEYTSINREKNEFQLYEETKICSYLSYEQYGGFGFRILFELSPLTIHLGSNFPMKIDSNIDTLETVNINSNIRGKYLFKKGILNFHLVYYLIGNLFVFLYGFYTFKSEKSLKAFPGSSDFWHTIFSRITIISLIFWGANILFGLLSLTQISAFGFDELSLLCLFNIYFNLILILSFGFGIISKTLHFLKNISVIFAIGFWAVFFLLAPRIQSLYFELKANDISGIDKINSEKTKNLLDFEMKAKNEIKKAPEGTDIKKEMNKFAVKFVLDTFKKNLKIEARLRVSVDNLIYYNELISPFIPSSYSMYLSEEISGSSPKGFQKFLDYIIDLREKFLLFYIKKRYNDDSGEVVPFMEPQEATYLSSPETPRNFFLGFIVIVFWILSVFFIAGLLKRKIIKTKNEVDSDVIKLFQQKSQSYLVLCENQRKKADLITYLSTMAGNRCIYNISLDDIDRNIPPSTFFYNCVDIYRADIKVSNRNLKMLGVQNIDDDETTSVELIKKILCAVVFASNDCEAVIIDSILKGESVKFENSLMDFFSYYLNKKQFFYIDTEMYSLKIEKEGSIEKNIPLNQTRLSKVSLR